MDKYSKKESEDIFDYAMRLFEIKKTDRPNDLDWADITQKLGLDLNADSLRKSQDTEFGGLQVYKKMKEIYENKSLSDDDVLKEYELKKQELYKERQKLRDEKNELNTWLREQSRMELFFERIDEAVEKVLSKKSRPSPQLKPLVKTDKKIVVGFADPHYDANFCIKGFFGEILNEYNPEIFKERMWGLRDEIVDFCGIQNCNDISIVDLGDSIEGILHLSQLQSLRGNAVDSIMDYAFFIVEWIDSLVEHNLNIDFYTSEGNHSDLRLLTGKKGDFPHENLEKIYSRTIKNAFKNHQRVGVKNSLNGLNYFNINGYNFLTSHGQNEKNLKDSIKDYEDTYGIKVDYFMVGHLHSKNEFEISKGKEVIQVRSIMGINDFSTSIKKTSYAGATMFTIHKNYGKKYVNEVKFN